MKLISLLNAGPAESQRVVDGLLHGQCWARFADGFVPDGAGATPSERECLEVIQPVLDRCEAELPRPGPLSVVLLPQGQDDAYSAFVRAQMSGVSGLTPGANLTLLRVGLEPGWRDALADAVAHEYHHAAWIALCPEIDRTRDLPLAEQLTFEGRACVFARRMTGDWEAPWTRPLNDPEFESRVRTALEQGSAFEPGPDAPGWWVYRLGTAAVLRSPSTFAGLTVSEWTRIPARTILAL